MAVWTDMRVCQSETHKRCRALLQLTQTRPSTWRSSELTVKIDLQDCIHIHLRFSVIKIVMHNLDIYVSSTLLYMEICCMCQQHFHNSLCCSVSALCSLSLSSFFFNKRYRRSFMITSCCLPTTQHSTISLVSCSNCINCFEMSCSVLGDKSNKVFFFSEM